MDYLPFDRLGERILGGLGFRPRIERALDAKTSGSALPALNA